MFGILVLLGIFLRVWFPLRVHMPSEAVYSDMNGYYQRALDLLSKGALTKPDLIYPPGYHVWIAFLKKWFQTDLALVWSHIVFGVSSCFVLAYAVSKWLGQRAGKVSLVLFLFYYPWIALSGLYMAETVYIFLLSLFFTLLMLHQDSDSKKHWFLIGFAASIAGWVKGLMTFIFPLLLLWLAWKRKPKLMTVFFLGYFIPLLIQGFYFQKYHGKFQLVSANSAINLVEGKCGFGRINDPDGYYFYSPLFLQLGNSKTKTFEKPFWDSAYYTKEGLKCIQENPKVLLTSFKYVYFLFLDNQLWPPVMQKMRSATYFYQLVFSILVFPGVLFGVWRIGRRLRSRRFIPLLIPLSIVICAWVFKSEIRYRVPFDIVLLPLSYYGWRFAFQLFQVGKNRRYRLAAVNSVFVLAMGLPILVLFLFPN